MNDDIETLMIEVRASTQGFASDIEGMRGALDTTLVDGFARAGDVLERGLLGAIQRGSLGFDDLKRTALQTMNEIAAQALKSGLGTLFSGGQAAPSGGGIGSLLTAALGGALGLPGRETGGPVSPGRGYIVGERGPELFVPTTSGRIDNGGGDGRSRDVRVAISLAAPRGTSAPTALRRSSRQVASSVRRALREF